MSGYQSQISICLTCLKKPDLTKMANGLRMKTNNDGSTLS